MVEALDNHIIKGKVEIWIDDTSIYHQVYLEDVELDINDVKREIDDYKELTRGDVIPILVDITKVKSITREARQYIAKDGTKDVGLATALIVKSSVGRVIGNFFMGLNKTDFPIKMFDNETDAVNWLKGFIK